MMTGNDKLLETIGKVEIDKIPKSRHEELEKILTILDEVTDDLSEKEEEFVYDMLVRFGQGATITDKQFEWLKRIYERYGD